MGNFSFLTLYAGSSGDCSLHVESYTVEYHVGNCNELLKLFYYSQYVYASMSVSLCVCGVLSVGVCV